MKSHIIPKFAAEWIKRTSATGFMRQMEQPNLRRQDFPTFRLLCASCEGIFARWEKQFAEEIFIPYQEKRPKNMPYGDWLLRFAISLAWRTTVISAEDFRQESPELAPYVDRALRSWKTFLLGEDQRWGTYAHHLFFLDDIAPSSTMPVPEKTHWYLLRGVDATIASSDTEVFAYTKLPGMVFWSGIQPRKPRGWENTRIWQAGITTPAIHQIEQNGFGEFLLSRVKYIAEANLSERQQNQLQQALQKDPERSRNSHSAHVFLTEQEWKIRQRRP